MDPLFQNLIVWTIAGGAAAWLVWNTWRTIFGGKKGCGCGSGKSACSPILNQLEKAKRAKSRESTRR